jgi:hypothetical protein
VLTVTAVYRQPQASVIAASAGRKIRLPVAVDAVRTPVTSPRRSTNQRFAIIAASGIATAPVARPLTTPQSKSSCHVAFMKTVRLEPALTPSSAPIVTRRTPKRSTSPAENGPPRPKKIRLIETAKPIVARLQPNSSWSGTISTPGVERNPAAVISVTNPTPATTQA